jgi:hypothetical protein
MQNVWIVNGNRRNGEVLDMTASIEGSGRICAQARKTGYGWIIERVNGNEVEAVDLAEDANTAYYKLRCTARSAATAE